MVAIYGRRAPCLIPQPRPAACLKNVRDRTAGEQLLAEIDAFLRANPKVTPTGFGRQAANNDRLIMRLQQGLDPRPVTQSRVRKFIREFGQ